MSYANFNALLKKINLKPKGVKEIVLEISDGALDGKIDLLSEMIDTKIEVAVDSQIVRYNVDVNAMTNKPIRTFRVDDKGVVQEVKPEGEQLAMDLGLPAEKVEIKQQPAEIDLSVIEQFIQSGLAPTFEDLNYDFVSFSKRLAGGETYMKLASELGISSGKIVEKIDEYRKRVAPSAAAWHEWMQRQGVAPSAAAEQATASEDGSAGDAGDTESQHESGESGHSDNADGFTPDWEAEGSQPAGDSAGGDGQREADPEAGEEDVDKEQLDEFILTDRPIFAEVEFDGQPVPFPDLLEKRLRENKTWREIAIENGMRSGQLSSRYNTYRKLAAKKMKGGGGAA
ncbi:hypothetical protein [Paenibacillus tianjinensis]|uniref:2-methylcitrate dehydratase n=1 Tax=Paenibacillus tianjinensis TaxID=2810347 RepID=A0ABX7L491_9BACL|nr:hypothetical protein [Paenibacillus tianjinensis]QSF42690.1 hypothetical protein JRJ22_15350 [Paenibacillus tianjinensis]